MNKTKNGEGLLILIRGVGAERVTRNLKVWKPLIWSYVGLPQRADLLNVPWFRSHRTGWNWRKKQVFISPTRSRRSETYRLCSAGEINRNVRQDSCIICHQEFWERRPLPCTQPLMRYEPAAFVKCIVFNLEKASGHITWNILSIRHGEGCKGFSSPEAEYFCSCVFRSNIR